MNSTQKFYLETLPYEKSEVPKKMVLNLIWNVNCGTRITHNIQY